MKNRHIILVISLLMGVVFVAGCTDSTNEKQYNTYNNTSAGLKISFEYPSDWNATDANAVDPWVYINGPNGEEVNIEIFKTSLDKESQAVIEDGYTYKGLYKVNKTNTQYEVYVDSNSNKIITIYLFEKNGKVVEIVGSASDVEVMDHIVETLKIE